MKPYLISAFDYSNSSAGNRCLHRLAHELNLRGHKAHVLTHKTNPDWNTRPMNINIACHAISQGAIVIYPETVKGNPLNGQTVVRWVLNYPGLLPWGEKTYAPTEKVFYYLPLFSPNPDENNLLFMSIIEKEIFNPFGTGERQGGVRYVGKGQDRMRIARTRRIYGDNCTTEIKWESPATRQEVADILRRSEYLLTYDNSTALIDEARMCGCPVFIVPDGATDKVIYDQVCNRKGLAFSWEELDKAKVEVKEFYEDYLRGPMKRFEEHIYDFIKDTQR